MAFLDPRVWLALLLAAAFGFGAGWYARGVAADAGEARGARVERHDSATAIVAAVEQSARVDSTVVASDASVAAIQNAVRRRGVRLVAPVPPAAPNPLNPNPNPNPENPHAATDPAAPPDAVAAVCGDRLDVGTVGLLRAARQGGAVEPAGVSDAALAAASAVTLSAFVDNDLEVVKLYRALAARHDALVDAVEQQLKAQAQ